MLRARCPGGEGSPTELDAEPGSPFGPSARKHLAPPFGAHAFPKSMLALTLEIGWLLVCEGHRNSLVMATEWTIIGTRVWAVNELDIQASNMEDRYFLFTHRSRSAASETDFIEGMTCRKYERETNVRGSFVSGLRQFCPKEAIVPQITPCSSLLFPCSNHTNTMLSMTYIVSSWRMDCIQLGWGCARSSLVGMRRSKETGLSIGQMMTPWSRGGDTPLRLAVGIGSGLR